MLTNWVLTNSVLASSVLISSNNQQVLSVTTVLYVVLYMPVYMLFYMLLGYPLLLDYRYRFYICHTLVTTGHLATRIINRY
jgi:hypothetical protein